MIVPGGERRFSNILRALRSLSSGLNSSMGAMYPTLYKMLDNGYISEYEKKVKKRQKRIYYHIEPAGVQRLDELVATYLEVTEGIMKIINLEPESEHPASPDADTAPHSGNHSDPE